MIPLRDNNPTRTFPAVTYGIVAACIGVYVFQLYLGGWPGKLLVMEFGIVPARLMRPDGIDDFVPILTHMFMHASMFYENDFSLGAVMHLIGNMWFLYIFGDNVEDNLGKPRFILFYLLCGFGAALSQIAIDPFSRVPMIGASGAIAGVLAGYVTLYPRARVVTLIPIFIFVQFAEIPAFFFVFFWFAYQLLMGFTSLSQVTGGSGGVAFFAHIGGFLTGLVLIRFFRRRPNDTYGFRQSSQRTSRYRGYRDWD